MYSYLNAIKNRLAEDQKDMLTRIYAPTVVAVPLACSRRDVCILPNGEIRSYGRLYADKVAKDPGIAAYLSSTDGGISWQKRYATGKMNACLYVEAADLYMKCVDNDPEPGIFLYTSRIGPDDPNPTVTKITDIGHNCTYMPVCSAYSNRIWFTSQQNDPDSKISFFFSDDFGKTWRMREFPGAGRFETVFPHKGLRWCIDSGNEPYAVEVAENEMLMLIRSSTDAFWQCRSHDGGDTWSQPEPSTFYGTDTTGFLLRLSDGRVINFWNNTKPLPEPNHEVTRPAVSSAVKEGWAEDAFTNRDVAHVAITDDGGDHWIGYRELLLNEVRNHSDYRYTHQDKSVFDKSVHQFQAFELPYNKVLVSVGQNISSRKLVIFDVDWLYESGRKTDFLDGLAGLTTHTYVKSLSGTHFRRLGNGHCSWNRTHNALMMADPDGEPFEAMCISKHHDPRLLNDIGGACWNFPMSRQGTVRVQLKLLEKQARFILTDRWYNTCDPYAATLSPFWFELDASDMPEGYVTVEITYNTDVKTASVSLSGKHFFKVAMTTPCPTGISYLILQCATDGDSQGFFVRTLEKF